MNNYSAEPRIGPRTMLYGGIMMALFGSMVTAGLMGYLIQIERYEKSIRESRDKTSVTQVVNSLEKQVLQPTTCFSEEER